MGDAPPKQWPIQESMGPPGGHSPELHRAIQRQPQSNIASKPPQGGAEQAAKRKKLNTDLDQTSFSRSSASPQMPRGLEKHKIKSPSKIASAQEQAGCGHRRSMFPIRPHVSTADWSNRQESVTFAIERAKMKGTVPVRPYAVEPPTCAPRYQNNSKPLKGPGGGRDSAVPSEPSDFFPWTGRHQEDNLNEMTTRNGFYDKGFQNECLSLRPTILSSLKTRSGPKILSALFVAALNQRQEHGTIATTSTFKPPPRVTLTDAKREAWLKDLANVAVPLRRLSRTIPHGIRGRMLLDHCLSKEIPVPRAIWLVKCVGANEIRAFKRKGTGGVFTAGGENKWVQDWTISVEQFLDGLIDACGTSGWRQRISYALRLLSYLFMEQLLDRKHYLDWTVRRFEDSDLDHLPIWLLCLNIHKHSLTHNRHLGRRVATAILTHLEKTLYPASKTTHQALADELMKEARKLMSSGLACFLMPQQWPRFKNLIREHLVSDSDSSCELFNDIRRRNENLKDPCSLQSNEIRASADQEIIRRLDSTNDNHDYAGIAHACLEISDKHRTLVFLCLQWAISSCRYGTYRIYAAAQYLRYWREEGVGLQDPIHEFLTAPGGQLDTNDADLFRLITELIHTGDFSVGRYCQWLLARGTTMKSSQSTTPEAKLLFELPLSGLSSPIRNLRRSLLRSLGQTSQKIEDHVNECKSRIAVLLPAIFPDLPTFPAKNHDPSPLESVLQGVASNYEIAEWLLASIEHRLEAIKSRRAVSGYDEPDLDLLDLSQFCRLRALFEQLKIFPVFAEILELCCKSQDTTLLAAVTVTVNCHFDTFSALDCSTLLFDLLFTQVQALPILKEADRSFPHALTDLAAQIPVRRQELRKLQKQFSTDFKMTVAAPSPISDNLIEAVDSNNGSFADEMEQLLLNGASIDDVTLSRAFETICQHYLPSSESSSTSNERCPELLSRLRAFNKKLFDSLMSGWIKGLIRAKPRPRLSSIFQPLICCEVVSITSILKCVTQFLTTALGEDNVGIAAETLESLIALSEEVMPSVQFRQHRFLRQQSICVQESLESALRICSICIYACNQPESPFCSPLHMLMNTANCRSFLKAGLAQAAIDCTLSSESSHALRESIREIFEWSTESLKDLSPAARLMQLVDNVNPLNLSVYQIEIDEIFKSFGSGEDLSAPLSAAVIRRSYLATETQMEIWSRLVSATPRGIAVGVREQVEAEIAANMDQDDLSGTRRNFLQNLLIFLSTTGFGLPGINVHIIRQYAAKLASLMPPLRSPTPPEGESGKSSAGLIANVKIILRLLAMHQSTFQQGNFAQDSLSQICLLLAQVYSALIQTSHRPLGAHALDVLTLLADSLSEALRARCWRTLEEILHPLDPELACVFGAYDQEDCKWLRLVNSHMGHAGFTSRNIQVSHTSAVTGDPGAENKAATFTESFQLRKWELVQDAMPSVAENDTSLSLTLFGARKAVL